MPVLTPSPPPPAVLSPAQYSLSFVVQAAVTYLPLAPEEGLGALRRYTALAARDHPALLTHAVCQKVRDRPHACVWCAVVWCGVVWCGAVRCGALQTPRVWCFYLGPYRGPYLGLFYLGPYLGPYRGLYLGPYLGLFYLGPSRTPVRFSQQSIISFPSPLLSPIAPPVCIVGGAGLDGSGQARGGRGAALGPLGRQHCQGTYPLYLGPYVGPI